MKINSAAGEFAFELHDLELRDDGIALTGKMGVWEADTVMTSADLRRIIRLVLTKPGCWGYLTRMFFSVRKDAKRGTELG